MHIATWNVNSLGVRLPQVLQWLQANADVQVLGVQETKLPDARFPWQALRDAGWQSCFFGQAAYNGVALLSRTPLRDVQHGIAGLHDDAARAISATLDMPGGVALRIVNVYVPNGQAPGSEKFAYKMRWLDALHDALRAQLARTPHLLLMGDFNITFDDRDVYDAQTLHESIHCTAQERAQLQRLCALGLHDALRQRQAAAGLYTWWDYRQRAFARNRGLRIDHMLLSSAALAQLASCHIDVAPRRNERPSDHAAVVLALSD